jgi:uncharacterized protein YcbK (DUF882 family)
MNFAQLKIWFNKQFENFQLWEFRCNDKYNSVVPPQFIANYAETVKSLQFIRYITGVPIVINSGYRTQSYNQSISGAGHSRHTFDASAIDFKFKFPFNTKAILKRVYLALDYAQRSGIIQPGGLHLYKRFIHIDTRGKIARW